MQTLHIEHAITGFSQWKSAFDGFADFRARAGVRGHRIGRPVDDDKYVMVDLDFDTTEQAQAFLEMLREKVWPSPQNAPALVGTPQTRILETVEGGQVRALRSAPDESLARVVHDSRDVGQEP